jgi:NhaP-type Na+/H+ or K+/H+ antiporter
MTRIFIGWLGPGGPASFAFTVTAIKAGVTGAEFISLMAACTILKSVTGHLFELTSPNSGPPINAGQREDN